MENEPELIRDQMQETRTALTEKLDTLQQKVSDTVESITTPVTETVQTVTEAVSDTVDTVKESVADAVDSVKTTFDLSHQVQERPWPMMLGSLAAGFMLGRLLPPPFRASNPFSGFGDPTAAMKTFDKGHNGHHNGARSESVRSEPAPEPEKGPLSGLADVFHSELDKLKGLGISVAVGLLRDLLTQSVEGEIGGRLKEWMDSLTEKLGGKPLEEPLVTPEPTTASATDPVRREAFGEDAPQRSAGTVKSSHESKRRW